MGNRTKAGVGGGRVCPPKGGILETGQLDLEIDPVLALSRRKKASTQQKGRFCLSEQRPTRRGHHSRDSSIIPTTWTNLNHSCVSPPANG